MLYSGGWDSYILVHDIRVKEKVGDLFGTYICGESIDVKDNTLLVGCYSKDHYLNIYDSRTMEKIEEVSWGDSVGAEKSS
jgi:hypothetical protein